MSCPSFGIDSDVAGLHVIAEWKIYFLVVSLRLICGCKHGETINIVPGDAVVTALATKCKDTLVIITIS